jgi:hypothetical protein
MLQMSDSFVATLFGPGVHCYRVVRDELPADARVIEAVMLEGDDTDPRLTLILESAAWAGAEESAPALTPHFAALEPSGRAAAMGEQIAAAHTAMSRALRTLALTRAFAEGELAGAIDEARGHLRNGLDGLEAGRPGGEGDAPAWGD